MDKLLKPGKLSIDPNSASATKEWRHWKKIFTCYVNRFLSSADGSRDEDMLAALVSCATPEVYEYFDHCETYQEAETTLEQLYVKKPNDIFARHLLRIEKQKPNQTLEDFRCNLVKLAKDCDFKDVTAMQYREDMIRDSFINGISSADIRQRLLEHKTLTLKEAFQQAVTLDDARRDNRAFASNGPVDSLSEVVNALELEAKDEPEESAAAINSRCNKCGSGKPHDYRRCRAKAQTCYKCGEKGHYSRACHLQKKSKQVSHAFKGREEQAAAVSECSYLLCSTDLIFNSADCLNHAIVNLHVGEQVFKALLDTGSSKSYIEESIAQNFGMKPLGVGFNVGMAQSSSKFEVSKVCNVNLKLLDSVYNDVSLYVMRNLCVDILLGRDFLERHRRVVFNLGEKTQIW